MCSSPLCNGSADSGSAIARAIRAPSGWPYLIGIPLVCAAFTATLLWAVWRITGTWDDPDVDWVRIAFGPALVLFTWMCGVTLQIGLMGSDFPDAAREWLARLGASVSIGMAGWIGLFVLAVFGPYWLASVTLGWVPAGVALAGGWVASAIGGYLSGKSSKTAGQPNEQADTPTRAMELLASVSPVIFLAGFLLFVSLGTHMLLRVLGGALACITVPVTRPMPSWLLWLDPVQREYWCFLYYCQPESAACHPRIARRLPGGHLGAAAALQYQRILHAPLL